MAWICDKPLSHDSPVIQKLDGIFILAMLPHQGEEPNPALPNLEIGRGEGHVRVDGVLIALGSVFRLPAEHLSLPVLA